MSFGQPPAIFPLISKKTKSRCRNRFLALCLHPLSIIGSSLGTLPQERTSYLRESSLHRMSFSRFFLSLSLMSTLIKHNFCFALGLIKWPCTRTVQQRVKCCGRLLSSSIISEKLLQRLDRVKRIRCSQPLYSN